MIKKEPRRLPRCMPRDPSACFVFPLLDRLELLFPSLPRFKIAIQHSIKTRQPVLGGEKKREVVVTGLCHVQLLPHDSGSAALETSEGLFDLVPQYAVGGEEDLMKRLLVEHPRLIQLNKLLLWRPHPMQRDRYLACSASPDKNE